MALVTMQEGFNPGVDTLAKRVKAMRERAGLSQARLAELSGLKQSDISKIERGVILRTTMLMGLARALQCNPHWLDTGEGEPDDLCLIIAVTDGDTLRARCEPVSGAYSITIRLSEIDAPERGQPYSQQARQSLAELCHQQQATILPQTTDRYGRTVARVECQGKDASAHQVETGMAWVFTRYSTDPGLIPLEAAARADRRGLWGDAQPVAPWEWRQSSKSNGN